MSLNLNSANVSGGLTWTADDGDPAGKTTNNGGFNAAGLSFSTGGSPAADTIYRALVTVPSGSPGHFDIDLSGALTNFFGGSVALARVKAVYVEHVSTSASTGNVVAGATVSNQVANFPVVPNMTAGSFFVMALGGATGIAVTAGTGDLVRLTNDDASHAATVKFAVVGSST